MTFHNLKEARKRGTWAPNLTAVTNVAALVVVGTPFFIVTADVVQCYCILNVDPTVAGDVQYRISLPFGVDFDDIADLVGLCSGLGSGGLGGHIQASVANNEALADSNLGGALPLDVAHHFAYRVK